MFKKYNKYTIEAALSIVATAIWDRFHGREGAEFDMDIQGLGQFTIKKDTSITWLDDFYYRILHLREKYFYSDFLNDRDNFLQLLKEDLAGRQKLLSANVALTINTYPTNLDMYNIALWWDTYALPTTTQKQPEEQIDEL